MSILELSKVIMYEIHYDYIKSKRIFLKPQTTDHRLVTHRPTDLEPLIH